MNRRLSFASSLLSRITAAAVAVAFTATLFVSVALGVTGELPAAFQVAGVAMHVA